MKRFLILSLLLSVFTFTSVAQDLTTFILVRHAEKATDDPRNPSLSAEGEARAVKLNEMLSPMDITAIYSTPLKRTRSTVQPIAASKSLEVQEYDYKNANLLKELMEQHSGGTLIISGHSNTTPILVNQLIGEERFGWLDEKEFDKIFIVTLSELGKGKVNILSY